MGISNEIKTIKDRVEKLLVKYNETQDSDKLLWLAYLCQYHDLQTRLRYSKSPYLVLKDVVMQEAPSMESIRRVRQKIQENGQHVGTKRKQKMKEESAVREWAVNN